MRHASLAILASLFLSGVLGHPVSGSTQPIVRMTLRASPNPAVETEMVTWTGTIEPVAGVVPSVSVGMDEIKATSCSPVPECSIGLFDRPSWTFTNLATKVTFSATSIGMGNYEFIHLWLRTEGVGCVGACPAVVYHVTPRLEVRISYSGPSPVTSGAVLHFRMTASANAGPVPTVLLADLPAGFATPTNITPASAYWDATNRRVESTQTIDPHAVLEFDTIVTAANGTTLTPRLTAAGWGQIRPTSRSLTIAVGTQRPPDPLVERLAGPDRYGTSAAISGSVFTGDATVAYVATGTNFPDALVGGPAAYVRGGPVLLVTRDSIPPAVKAELTHLMPATIYVLGGTGVISDSVKNALEAYAYNPVIRLSGTDRYGTANAVNNTAAQGYGGPVFLATGTDFPDALSGGPAAAQYAAPIVLATRDGLPTHSQYSLHNMTPTRFILLGGTGVLSSALVSQLGQLYPGVPVERWAGADRYATSAAISAHAFPGGADIAYLAVGTNYPDALSGGPVAAVGPGPILLARSTCLPSAVYDELQRLNPTHIVLLGGTGVLSDAVPRTRCAS